MGKSVTNHAVIVISTVRTSASKKVNLMAFIRTLMISTTTFERMKEEFYGFRQTEYAISFTLTLDMINPISEFEDIHQQIFNKV